ncbi:MAG: rhamnulokinase [Streptosporangiaceae bacterium]
MAAPFFAAAADLGASSGRVMVAEVGPGRLALREIHRFGNLPVTVAGTMHTDVLRLYHEVLEGLRLAASAGEITSVGIDSWGVDYGLLDADSALLGNPVHYRDARTAGAAERLGALIDPRELYAITGVPTSPINTLCQLVAAAGSAQLEAARTLLLLPDLLTFWLTGAIAAEITNASTTQLLDVRTGVWAAGVAERVGLRPEIFPPLRKPGDIVGPLLPAVRASTGLGTLTPVTTAASHDTASAVVAVPAAGTDFAYISCGTWSLVGVELDQPVLSEPSRQANFTNETGVDRTVRYLRNVMGLWLLQESMRCWAAAGLRASLAELLDQAASTEPLRAIIDADDAELLPAGDMPARIVAACARTGQPAPSGPGQTVRCILDSLALAHRRAVRQAQLLSGRTVSVVHMVGGGSRNALLCQRTADACGLPVLAGPAEATALGNALIQARAHGAAPADLAGLRALVRRTQPVRRYEPSGSASDWQAAARRIGQN